MAATIVSEGVRGGDLFSEIKFFLLQRVPSRQRWIELVEANGGEVVKLEKQADIIIADHARKDCPSGSISWRYIEQSVKEGSLQDIEDHRAGQAAYTPREVGSTRPAKSGRTTFTAEDDRILMDWVTRAERKGFSTKGNELYRLLEQKNNRHTLQSWRDRWIKYLAQRPRPELPEDDDAAGYETIVASPYKNHLQVANQHRLIATPDNITNISPSSSQAPRPHSRQPAQRHPRVSQKTVLDRSEAKPAKSNKPHNKPELPTSPPKALYIAKSVGGTDFTEEETAQLVSEYEDIENIEEDRLIDAWAAYAAANPNHTAQEWRNYFVRRIIPLVQKRPPESKNPSPPSTATAPPSTGIPRNNITDKASASKYVQAELARAVPSPKMVESPRTRRAVADPSTTEEIQFREHLTALAEVLELEVNFNPVICGRLIPLFEVWQVVRSENFGGYDEVNGRGLWPQVARMLNFNDFQHSDAPKALQACYGEILVKLENEMVEYNNFYPDLAESEEEAMIESQLRRTAAHELQVVEEEVADEEVELELVQEQENDQDDQDDNLDVRPSTPRQPLFSSASKRSFGSDRVNQDGSPLADAYNKRQRIDKGKGKGKGKELEIPSTPEEVINNNQMIQSPYKASHRHSPGNGYEDGMQPFRKPNMLAEIQVQRNMEPETQDFEFLRPEECDVGSVASMPSSSHRRNEQSSNLPTLRDLQKDSSTQSQTSTQREKDLQAFIYHHVSLGYRQDVVIEALEVTTMNTGDAALVMEELSSGDGIPENIEGVWTVRDDAALEKIESAEFQRIEAKHGRRRIILRQKFLAEQREARMEIGEE